MPKVKSYSAAWLAGNSHGHRLFEPSSESLRTKSLLPAGSSRKKNINGPRRTIARRGTEVFVAVGKEIRWGDLAYLKEEYYSKQPKGRSQTPRIKREDSSFSVADEDIESIGGLRVRFLISYNPSLRNVADVCRHSKPLWPMTFAN